MTGNHNWELRDWWASCTEFVPVDASEMGKGILHPSDTAATQSPDPFSSCLSFWEAGVLLSSSICSTSAPGFINRQCCKCQPLIKSAPLSALSPASHSGGGRTSRRALRA